MTTTQQITMLDMLLENPEVKNYALEKLGMKPKKLTKAQKKKLEPVYSVDWGL